MTPGGSNEKPVPQDISFLLGGTGFVSSAGGPGDSGDTPASRVRMGHRTGPGPEPGSAGLREWGTSGPRPLSRAGTSIGTCAGLSPE